MKNFHFYLKLMLVLVLMLPIQQIISASNINVELYTPFTKVSVAPGSTVNYKIDVINNGDQTVNENIGIRSIPRSWTHTLTASGLNVNKVAVLGNEKKTLDLKVEVPFKVRKGYYTFYAKMGDEVSLPLTINVTTAGSNETQLSCEQKNMEGTSKSNFNFSAVLKNKTPNKQNYALMASPPKGWKVVIKPNHKQATSTEVEPNATKTITYDVKPPYNVKAGTYKIPVRAVSGSTSADMELEVVITGTYEMTFTTPSGLLSANTTAGDEKKIELLVKNTGSTQLKDIELSSVKPKNWEVTFDKTKIESLEPGKSSTVYATIKAGKKSIPGDYVTKIKAKTSEVNHEISFRVMVKTPMLMGWLGIVIILLAVGGIWFLIRKFGRR
ncbi:COG1470 family protein [Carboxylicivirga linearis]|uniref:Alpha-galactosidase NEW3 domain-containing protein n=1 Tax=Carboxylicivirga linearis TaxID=1628157 RepID=A0ABS5JUU4_9BACT|nr:NEW3 domain-containing protein [Carboxylicivirga linearis]MBS2098618.1 hypothetical protein [Carboxylicivirga linearis]